MYVAFVNEEKENFRNDRTTLHVDQRPSVTRSQGFVNEKVSFLREQPQRAFLFTFFAGKKVIKEELLRRFNM